MEEILKKINTKKQMVADFLNITYAYSEEYKQAVGILKHFNEGEDKWIIALFRNIIVESDMKEESLKELLSKYTKVSLFENIKHLTPNENEEYMEYLNRLNETEAFIKVLDLNYKMNNSILTEHTKKKYEASLVFLIQKYKFNERIKVKK